ncbi:MAG TPA: hypothetical protein VG944_13550, partial [Fimbriimonas sp.]|nr:hypothetical protein [Fimbriimonas sp.]
MRFSNRSNYLANRAVQAISRRDFVYMAGGSLGALLLAGCGGGGGGSHGGSVAGSKKYTGSIKLPVPVNPAKVQILSGPNTSPVKGTSFSASAPGDAPTVITAFDTSANKAVLFGIYDPATETATVDETSSAAALLFIALGAFTMTRDGIKPMLDKIKSSSQLASLATTIQSRLAADPYAIANGDPQIISALSAAANGFDPMLSSRSVRPATTGTPTALALIQPTDEVDGATFVQLDSGTGFKVQNTKRRTSFVYTYLTAHYDSDGKRTDVDPPQKVGETLEVPSTESLLHLGQGWSPVTSQPVSLTIDGSDTKTEYTHVYLTTAFLASEPAFFKDPKWAGEVVDWRASMGTLFETTVLAVVSDVVFGAIGYAGLTWASSELAAVAQRVQASLPTLYDLLYDAYKAGQSDTKYLIYAGAKKLLQNALKSPTDEEMLATVAPLLQKVAPGVAQVLAQGKMTFATLAAVDAAIAAFLVVGALAVAADIGAIFKDTGTGNKGDLWTELIFKETLKLTPQEVKVGPGETVPFEVITSDVLVYDWIQDSPFATLSGSTSTGNSLSKVPDKKVNLISTGSDTKAIHLTVVAYDTSSGTPKEVGRAGAKVEFLIPATISPLNPILTPSATQVFNVTVSGTVPQGSKYFWTVTGNGDVDGNPTSTTTTPTATYKASTKAGIDRLVVEVKDSAGTLLARTGTQITVGAQVKLTPNATPSLKAGSKTTFKATVAGGTPTGAQFHWVLTSSGQIHSSIGDSNDFTSNSNQVTYWAGYSTAVDHISVTLLDDKGKEISSDGTDIDILEYGGWELTADDGTACCGGIAPGDYTEPLTLGASYYSDGVNFIG